MKLSTVGRFITALVIPQLAGAIGAIFTTPAINTWYSTLKHPVITPPNWIFAPVWTSLFLLMGVSLFLIMQSEDSGAKKVALSAFAAQLILNIGWSVLFFKSHDLGTAFAEILALITTIIWTIYEFSRISKLSAWLLAPYLAWVMFASVLTYQFWMLNRLA